MKFDKNVCESEMVYTKLLQIKYFVVYLISIID